MIVLRIHHDSGSYSRVSCVAVVFKQASPTHGTSLPDVDDRRVVTGKLGARSASNCCLTFSARVLCDGAGRIHFNGSSGFRKTMRRSIVRGGYTRRKVARTELAHCRGPGASEMGRGLCGTRPSRLTTSWRPYIKSRIECTCHIGVSDDWPHCMCSWTGRQGRCPARRSGYPVAGRQVAAVLNEITALREEMLPRALDGHPRLDWSRLQYRSQADLPAAIRRTACTSVTMWTG